jgi:hypothetical protein
MNLKHQLIWLASSEYIDKEPNHTEHPLARTNYSSPLKIFEIAQCEYGIIVSRFNYFQRRRIVCPSKGTTSDDL